MTVPKFEFPLVPKKGRIIREDLEAAYKVEPLPKIPKFLVPFLLKGRSKPPMLHYGWPANTDALKDYVAEHDIMVFDPSLRPSEEVKRIEWHDNDDDDWYGKEVVEEYNEDDPYLQSNMVKALEMIAEELQLVNKPDLTTVYSSEGRCSTDFVSLITNYDIRSHRIEESDKHKLMERFGYSNPPMWYLDLLQWHWT